MPAAAYPFNYRKHKCINVNIVLFISKYITNIIFIKTRTLIIIHSQKGLKYTKITFYPKSLFSMKWQ